MPRLLVVLLAVGLLAACGGTPSASHTATGTATRSTSSERATAPSSPSSISPTARPHPTGGTHVATPSAHRAARPRPGTRPPSWLGTRPLPRVADGYGRVLPTPRALRNRRFTLPDALPMLPGRGFASRVETAPAAVIARSTWRPGCPVAAGDLAWVRLTFWGFDHRRHTGELLVNARVASDVVSVFRKLYAARFPIEQMRIATRADLTAEPTGDGNETGSFVCRPATGRSSGFSEHAYGLAVDVNTFQNPYVKGARVLPELASAYLDRSRHAPGMIHPGDVVTRAFASIGWGWGGDWHSLKDYQHFSANGR